LLAKLIDKVVPVRPGETTPMLLATCYGFCVLFAFYLLRPVRDEIGAADRGNLQLLWTAVFFVMLLAVPLYSIAVAKLRRGIFVPLANRFFALNLIAFYAALVLLPESARVWIDRVFYVWLSVFALFVVTVFWGLVVDLFREDQGKRIFGFITVGSSLGGIVGSATTSVLAPHVPVFLLLLLAVMPLEAAARLARGLDRRAEDASETLNREPEALIGGSAWSGIGLVVRSPQLRTIALWILLMTFASTMLYFVQSHLIGEAIADRALRRAFLARIDLTVNVLTIFTQTLLTARILQRLGVGLTLSLLPAVATLGFVALGSAPASIALTVLLVVRVLYDSARHALAKPAREVLFTNLDREQRYKSKAFIDAAVYRGGDLISGWMYAGFTALGMTLAAIALVAAPVALVWVLLGRKLERRGRSMDDVGSTPTA
jgi:AAA family ATP:ADP antiporter